MKRKEIVDIVIDRLDGLRISANAGRPTWSTRIKNALGRAGKECGFWVYATGTRFHDGPEWVYDVTWLEYEEESFTAAALVVECEWGGWGSIQNDFQKLLLARADVRLMIFDGRSGSGTRDVVKSLAEQVWHFERSSDDDIWLFAARERENNGWSFRWFVIEDGEMDEVAGDE